MWRVFRLTEKEIWDKITDKLTVPYFGRVKLKIGDDEVTIHKQWQNNKVFFPVYVNGWIRGSKEFEEKYKKYWWEKDINKSNKMIEFDKKLAKLTKDPEHIKSAEIKVIGKSYTPFFKSLRTLKSQYKKRGFEIEILEEE